MNKNRKKLYEFIDMSDGEFPIRCNYSAFKRKGQTFPSHWHEHIELHYYTKGNGIVYCSSKPIPVEAGDLVIVNSNELHSGENLSGELEYIVIIIGVSHLRSSIVDLAETKYITPIEQNLIMFRNKISRNSSMAECVNNIAREYGEKQTGFELEVKANIYHLLALLMRGYVEKVLSHSEYRLRVRNLERFSQIFDYIDEYYAQELSIDKLAHMMNISNFHFCRLFKEITGKTLSEYVNRIRVEKAERLLLEQECTVSEIAFRCGYNDTNYFSRVFKQHRGMSPSLFRSQRASRY